MIRTVVVVSCLSMLLAACKKDEEKAAGSAPDIIYVIPGQAWTLQQEGWLMPVDDVVQKLGEINSFCRSRHTSRSTIIIGQFLRVQW